MKKVNYWFACLIATAALVTTFTACSSDDDPNFNPPTVSMGSTTSGEINLSDELKFELPVNINSEAGLASIVVKDAEGKEWLNQTTFTNPNSVASVTLDLSSCKETKLLLLTVTAIAKDGKVTSNVQPYSLNVYVPQLYIALSNVATITDAATMDIKIGRGVKALAKVDVYLNNTLVKSISLSSKATEKKILESVDFTGLNNGKNPVKVEVFEEGAAAASVTENSDAVKVDMNSIEAFLIDGSYDVFEVRRNKNDGTTKFIKFATDGVFDPETYMPIENPIWQFWNLTYDANHKMVTKIEMTIQDPMTGEPETIQHVYEFTYNSFNELTKATLDNNDYVTDIVYENGVMVSYKINGNSYQPKYAEVNGMRVRVDCLDAEMTGTTFGFTGNEQPNPYYISGLPAIIPGDILGIPTQLLYSQYLFNSLGTTWTSGWIAGTNSHWDQPSLTAKFTRKDGKEHTYEFLYTTEE